MPSKIKSAAPTTSQQKRPGTATARSANQRGAIAWRLVEWAELQPDRHGALVALVGDLLLPGATLPEGWS